MNQFQKHYLSQKMWEADNYLLSPYTTNSLPTISAVKKCRACKKTLFSSYFADCDLFVDHKLCSCTKCYNKRKNETGKKWVRRSGYEKECKKCGDTKPLSDFAIYKSCNKLYDYCRNCNSNPLYEESI